MVLSQEKEPDAHPYWYARIIGIYHTLVRHESSSDPITIEFLFVRWYGLDLDRTSRFGWKMRRLPKVGFVPDDPDAGSSAFGFLDPAQVIHQENSTLLEWLEPVSPVVPARQHISWI